MIRCINPKYFLIPILLFFILQASAQPTIDKKDWQTLFNGRDINDWVAKINHHETGDNYGNTFRVEDSMIKVRYN